MQGCEVPAPAGTTKGAHEGRPYRGATPAFAGVTGRGGSDRGRAARFLPPQERRGRGQLWQLSPTLTHTLFPEGSR